MERKDAINNIAKETIFSKNVISMFIWTSKKEKLLKTQEEVVAKMSEFLKITPAMIEVEYLNSININSPNCRRCVKQEGMVFLPAIQMMYVNKKMETNIAIVEDEENVNDFLSSLYSWHQERLLLEANQC